MMDFQYISTNIPGVGCSIDDFESEIPGCDCSTNEKCETSGKCSCLRYGHKFSTNDGILVIDFDTIANRPIFECGSTCGCDSNCGNRLVRDGIQTPLDVVEIDGKGFGLRSLETIRRGQFVCEYAGEVIDFDEATRRFRSIADGSPNFIFVLREHTTTSSTSPSSSDSPDVITTCIDPTRFGNLGRFINHSCDPNLCIIPVRYDHPTPHLGLFAAREIAAGEELCYDYGGGDRESTALSTKKCLCGAEKCRGFLPLDKGLFIGQ